VLADASARDLAAARALAHRALGLLELAAGRSEEALEHFRPMQDADGSVHLGIVLQNAPEFVEAAAQLTKKSARPSRSAASPAWPRRPRPRTCWHWSPAAGPWSAPATPSGSSNRPLPCTPAPAGRWSRPAPSCCSASTCAASGAAPTPGPTCGRRWRPFQRLGMPVWADRARDELRATGEATGDPATDTLAHLTSQELRIAAAVGEGATNREVAAQLFLSPRTVDYHLRKVFQKLHISSRADLIRLVAADAHGDARRSNRAR
jgi:DNA-binding CsgD family transcriptional regulator